MAMTDLQPGGDKIDSPSQAYCDMLRLWDLPRSLWGGTAAIRQKRTTYLPQEPGESDAAYDNRLYRSFLFNAFRRTITNVNGKIFSKALVLDDDVPSNIKLWTENVDLAGRNLDTLASDVLIDGLQTGLSHVLVDMQAPLNTIDAEGNPRPPTVAEERIAGRRPYFVHIKPENLIGWRSEVISGVETLTQIRIKECITIPDGEFGEMTVERIRVLWPDRFAVYEKPAGSSDWQLVQEGPVTLGFIPLATFYAGRTSFMRAEPPLQDLADLNVMHWQSSSDQRHILHFARAPFIFGAGFTKEEVEAMTKSSASSRNNSVQSGGVAIGPNRMIMATQPEAKLQVIEHTGKAIEAGRVDLQDIEDRMRIMGLELFLTKPGNVTATGRAIDANEVNSQVKAWALSLKDTLEQALGFMAQWSGMGEDAGGSITINTDYGITLQGAQDGADLLKARQTGDISKETFWAEWKRRGILSDDFDPAQERAHLEDEMPAPTDPNAVNGSADAAAAA